MPQKKTATKRMAPPKTAAKKPASKPTPKRAPKAAPAVATEACPRCGTATFGPEERIRAEGRRIVRYSVLVCERGHTFAHPVRRAPGATSA